MPHAEHETLGVFQYINIDNTITAEERAFYSLPAHSISADVAQPLHDMRGSSEITPGPDGIDVQGFTYVNHDSALTTKNIDDLEKDTIREIYIPEVIDLICKVTGAKRAVVDSISCRRRAAAPSEERSEVMLKGSDFDVAISKLPREGVRVPGIKKHESVPPIRVPHIDYSVKSLRDMVRLCRTDIKDVAQPAIDAEQSGKTPRYAVYSVWRPLKPVERDPLAVLDWRSTNKDEVTGYFSRALSSITEDGEWLRETLTHMPPQHPEAHRWYWLPKQQPNEVLIIKFADTLAGEKGAERPDVAAHCVHCSPRLSDTEQCPARESIECRVVAFWD